VSYSCDVTILCGFFASLTWAYWLHDNGLNRIPGAICNSNGWCNDLLLGSPAMTAGYQVLHFYRYAQSENLSVSTKLSVDSLYWKWVTVAKSFLLQSMDAFLWSLRLHLIVMWYKPHDLTHDTSIT